MRLNRLSSLAIAATCLAGAAQAQNVHFNEIYASHTSTDDQEYIELIGTPNMSLDGIVICVVEGQGGGQGTLDRVWDLTGMTMPADGFFVLGNVAVANVDYDLANGPHTSGGLANNIENGTETFYILNVPNPLDIDDLENTLNNTSIDTDFDGMTLFSDDPINFITIENVTMLGTGSGDGAGGPGTPHDITHDCAAIIGPDGSFFPAGISRPGDYPNDWCGDTFLDFGNPGGPDQTPGTANPTFVCGAPVAGTDGCGGMSGGVGTPFCDPADINSTGMPTVLTGTMGSGIGSGLHLESAQGPANQLGYFLVGTGFSEPGLALGSGHLCFDLTPGNAFGRYNTGATTNSVGVYDAMGVLQNFAGTSAVGSGFDVPSTLPSIGGTIMPGQTWHFQIWHRESGGDSNFSNGLSVTF